MLLSTSAATRSNAVEESESRGTRESRSETVSSSRLLDSSTPRLATRLGRLQREAAGEDGQPAEQSLFGRGEQVVAPGDRVAHRLQPRRQVAGAAGQERQEGRFGHRREPGTAPTSRASNSAGGRWPIRAAASSIASGKPSRRRQIPATAFALAAVRAKPERAPRRARRRGAPPRTAASSIERQSLWAIGEGERRHQEVVLARRRAAPPGW